MRQPWELSNQAACSRLYQDFVAETSPDRLLSMHFCARQRNGATLVVFLYMPAVGRPGVSEMVVAQPTGEEKAYEVKLWLLSKLKEAAVISCDDGFLDTSGICGVHRHTKLSMTFAFAHIYKFKDDYIRGHQGIRCARKIQPDRWDCCCSVSQGLGSSQDTISGPGQTELGC